MKYQFFLALVSLAAASNVDGVVEKRQAVTAKIAPTAPAPAACSGSFSGRFAINVVPTNGQQKMVKRQSMGSGQMADGQVIASGAPAAQIASAPPAVAPTNVGIVTQIHDGQIQAGANTGTFPQATGSPASGGSGSSGSGSSGSGSSGSGSPVANFATGNSTSGNGTLPTTAGTVCNAQLTMTLEGGVLTDSKGRTGYIASNFQFQFDGPPQSGAIYTAGWSVCSDGTLALGGSNIFYECLSGSFYNLYDRYWAAQCQPIKIYALPDVCQH